MKKILPIAVLSALAGVNGAQAVHVNPDGLGQVLLYPYFTTEGGQDTYVNLVNTTDQVKAVKVRFRESLNSAEVLDFNLYLSPWDHWSAVITAGTADDAATITSGDTSCTVPNAISAKAVGETGSTISFRNFEYSTDSQGGLDRTNEGYVEVIEMGVVTDATLAAAATHVSGVPSDCGALVAAWSGVGQWVTASDDGVDTPTGGLYGYGVLIDVAEGTDATYDAVALDAFQNNFPIHFAPGDSFPNFGNGGTDADIFDGVELWELDADDSLDAVSAVLMHDTIANDFVLEPSIAAGTDWVITFPTKSDYVNVPAPALDPFTEVWSGATSTACEAISIQYFNREEAGVAPDELDFSPAPPGPAAFALCAEANVLTFNSSNVLKASDRGTGSDLSVIHDNGWMTINFKAAGTARNLEMFSGEILEGLPVVGFAVQKYVNGDLGGVLSNYAGSVTHKGTRSVSP